MSDLEKIFKSNSDDMSELGRLMDLDQFKSALTEVFEKIRVTDDQIESASNLHYEEPESAKFRVAAKWSRDLQNSRIEKLLNP